MSVLPKSVVYIRPDTIGDLVLFLPALARFQAAWPKARHTLVVRPGYDGLAPLFPPQLHWVVARINSFKQRPAECSVELSALVGVLEKLEPDLILAPAWNRTWLEAAVAARFPKVRCAVLGSRRIDPIFQAALRLDLGIDPARNFGEIVPVDEKERDWENQHRFADHLLGEKGPRTAPRIAVPASAAKEADGILAEKGLVAGRWAAVFAGGSANVSVKSWPVEAFGELSAWIQGKKKTPVLLLGHESESELLKNAASATERAGGSPPGAWLGGDGGLPVLAALLERAAFYVGNDTGAMHLSAALGRPVVGIFGGGTWPRFRPVSERAVSVVQPLPCFGCYWDCHFGDAPCVKTLEVEDVRRAVERALAPGDRAFNEVIEVRHFSDDALKLIAAEVPRYLALQRDRLDRQHKIEELKAESDGKDAEIADLKGETDTKDAEIADLKRETDAKDDEIADLKRETDAKDSEIADLKKAAEERKAESDTKDDEIVDLKKVCNEREALIIQQDRHIKNFQKIVADLNTAAAERDVRLAKAEGILAKLPKDAATWAEAFSAKDAHIGNLEAARAALEQGTAELRNALAERDRSIANYAAGWGKLEQAKHYGRLLAEKEHAIQNLHRVCVERENLIKQLAAEAAGPAAALRKLWLALAGFVRGKISQPIDAWLFRKIVEEYWMQIGVLRHYDPRPIAWDRRIPKKTRVSEARLPKIALVTPCYGQETFIESTMLSILNQNYPKLLYVVQDGGSPDSSPKIIERYAGRLRHWESGPDGGQSDAVRRGFARLDKELGPDDVMSWLNSDDLVAPHALRLIGSYFATHPGVDVIYGHRIIIDGHDSEIGRWIMPRHDPAALEWIDYVPQETLYWRKSAWDLVGGVDPDFHFALDWDLLARFQLARCRIVRLPYFLGCFRIHEGQKTNQHIHTTGAEEMARVRARFHPGREQDFEAINAHARRTRIRGALNARLLEHGIRW